MENIANEILNDNQHKGTIFVVPEFRFEEWWKRLDKDRNISWCRIKEDKGPVLQDHLGNTIGIEIHNLFAMYVKEEGDRHKEKEIRKKAE